MYDPRPTTRLFSRIFRTGRTFALLACVAFGAIATLPAQSVAAAAPEPSPLPIRWEFDLSAGPLRIVSIAGEDGVPRSYYFMTYSVTNRTGADRPFTPLWELATDHGITLRSGEGVPVSVVNRIKQSLDQPLLEDQVEILGTLRQGRANTRYGLVVWPAYDLRIDEITVYATGFSGESTRITSVDPETGEELTFVLRKTWMRRHPVPGDLIGVSEQTIETGRSRWVMR